MEIRLTCRPYTSRTYFPQAAKKPISSGSNSGGAAAGGAKGGDAGADTDVNDEPAMAADAVDAEFTAFVGEVCVRVCGNVCWCACLCVHVGL